MGADADLEKKIVEKGLTAPSVTSEQVENKIVATEIVTFKTKAGKILRWAVLTMENGFAVIGDPSAAVSVENDNEKTGTEIALSNAKSKIWGYEGYLLADKLHNQKGKTNE